MPINVTKGFVYAIRTDCSSPKLLAFETHDEPWGYEVPRGQIEPGETPLQGAIRELHEESGIVADISQIHHIGTTIWEDEEQHFYLCMVADGLPDAFDHCITGSGGDAGWIYSYRWLDLDEPLSELLVQGGNRFIAEVLATIQ